LVSKSKGNFVASEAQIAAGIITNTSINAAAAIAYSKLNLAGQIVNADVAAGAAIAKSKLASLAIVDADVAAGAAIGMAKLAATADTVSVQVVGSSITQKSENLVGPIITSDFTTTSASLVDVTGVTITLAATNNVTSKLRALFMALTSNTSTVTFSLSVSTGTADYTWRNSSIQTSPVFTVSRNVDNALAVTGGTNMIVDLDGYISGTTSGIIVKVQASISGAITLTIKVGSALRGSY